MKPGTQPDDDALRAAMDRVRGLERPQPASPSQRHFWDLRGKLADDLARVPTPGATAWPAPVAGLVAGLWAAVMSWLVFAGVQLLAWVFAPLGSGAFADVMRASGATWIVANAGALMWQGATMSLPPLLATAVILLFQRRAGAWLVDATAAAHPGHVLAPFAFALGASASAQLLAAATISNATLAVSMGRSAWGALLVAAIGFGWGIQRVVVIPLPRPLRQPLTQARRFLQLVSIVGALGLLASAALHHRAFLDVLNAIAGDTTSKAQVLLLCVAYLPTLVAWAAAFTLGPGFTLGLGTTMSVGGVTLGALPPVPLFALVPDAVPGWSAIALGIPAACALIATFGRASSWTSMTLSIGLGAAGAALLALISSGGIGPGRLALVGPSWWAVALAGAGWMTLAHLCWWFMRWARARMADAPEADAEADGKLES